MSTHNSIALQQPSAIKFPKGLALPNKSNTHDLIYTEALLIVTARRATDMVWKLTETNIEINKDSMAKWFSEHAPKDNNGLLIAQTLCAIIIKLKSNTVKPLQTEFLIYFKMIKEIELYLNGFASPLLNHWFDVVSIDNIEANFFA